MCDFKPGDEVVCVNDAYDWGSLKRPKVGQVYMISDVLDQLPTRGRPDIPPACGVYLCELPTNSKAAYPAVCFRKVQKRNHCLTIQAFSVIKDGGFEEPKRAPSKKRERTQ